MTNALYEQLSADLGEHLPRRGWHDFVARNRVETYKVVVNVLEILGLDAVIMSSPRGEDGTCAFYVGAVDQDEQDKDFEAARFVLEQMKRIEALDKDLQGLQGRPSDRPSAAGEGLRPSPETRVVAEIDVSQISGPLPHNSEIILHREYGAKEWREGEAGSDPSPGRRRRHVKGEISVQGCPRGRTSSRKGG